ncbi:MAG: hypothetical protein E7A27_18070 [Erysipelotrichaceae bacterium]|nr:hypothetical protein [[Clostridium] innocuum]MDU1121698.1 hypothetical protein [Erysipelotrichaceae bacterium]
MKAGFVQAASNIIF